MLKFFYCFLFKKYIPERCFDLLESDTDSMYFAISRNSLDDCVPDHLKSDYFRERLRFLPAEACPEHAERYTEIYAYICTNIQNTTFEKEPLVKFGQKKNAA